MENSEKNEFYELRSLIYGLYDNQQIINEKLDALIKASIDNIQKDPNNMLINLNSKLDKMISKASDIEVRLQILDDINGRDPEIDEIKVQLNELKEQISQITLYRDLY